MPGGFIGSTTGKGKSIKELMTGSIKIKYKIFKRNYSLNHYDCSKDHDLNDIINWALKEAKKNGYVLDATDLKENLFSAPEKMIFISHLHTQEGKAKRIKQYIEKNFPQYRCFIDSEVWHNVYEAIRLLKVDRAAIKNNLYNCDACEPIAMNLYLMLSIALTEAIKDSAAFIYVSDSKNDSPESIFTTSPWIYHELVVSSIVPTFRDAQKILVENFSKSASALGLRFRYEAPVDHLISGTLDEFITLMKG